MPRVRGTRRQRAGGVGSVVQDGAVWRVKETLEDGSEHFSDLSWSTRTEAQQHLDAVNAIRSMTPNQQERRDVGAAVGVLARLKRGGRKTRRPRRRHH